MNLSAFNKYCMNCPHFNANWDRINWLICYRKPTIIDKGHGVIGERIGTPLIAGLRPIKFKKEFTVPNNCPYQLEHILE